MSTTAEVTDPDALTQAINELRSDANGRNRKSWVIVGHVDNNPCQVEVVAQDTSADASLEDFRCSLKEDQVMYGLLRLSATVDMSNTVKFIYVHWVGDQVPFVKKGRFGVVHGSLEQHFNPYHLILETGNTDELTEEELVAKLDESSFTKSKVLESTPIDGRHERGFTAHETKRHIQYTPKSVAPAGATVEISPELQEAIGEVRNDASDVTWVLAGFEESNVKNPLVVIDKGDGDIEGLKAGLQDDQVMYGLYRTSDVMDDLTIVKFVYLYWVGEQVKPLTKGRVSAFTGPVEKIFSPAHATLFFNNRYDIEENVIQDKVQAGSGSKSFVM